MLHIKLFVYCTKKYMEKPYDTYFNNSQAINASPQPMCAVARGLLPIQEACTAEQPIGEPIRQGSIRCLQ